MSFAAYTAEATGVKIEETAEVDIDFDYINSTADNVISETLLDVGFTLLETRNASTGSNTVVETKCFYKSISGNFTQSELNELVAEINNVTNCSNPDTVINDFDKIGTAVSTFLNHGTVSKRGISKRGWYVRRRFWVIPVVGFETDPKKKFGVGVEVDPCGVKIVLRFKTIRIRIPIVNWGKRDIES